MEKLTFFVLFISIALLSGCGSKNKSDEIKNYAFEQKSGALSPALQEKLGSWLTEGTVCYGLVVTVNSTGKIHKGVPVKAKALSFNGDTIRMKALEKVNVAEIKGCTKMGLAKGELWWETEGDLFKTREEAIAYLTKNGWY